MIEDKKGDSHGGNREIRPAEYEVRTTQLPNWSFVQRFFYPREGVVYINMSADRGANVDWLER